MKEDANSAGQPPERGDPQIPVDGGNQLVAKFSRLYAQAAPEDQLVLRVWIRDIILGRKVGSANMIHARRSEKRMIEAGGFDPLRETSFFCHSRTGHLKLQFLRRMKTFLIEIHRCCFWVW
jgi:hypothetical protein